MKYKIKYFNTNNKIVSKVVEVSNFEELNNLSYTILDVKQLDKKLFTYKHKIDFLPILKQLQIMLNANLTINDAIDLTLKTQNNHIINDILITIQNSIKNSTNLTISLNKYKRYLPHEFILFFQLGINNGNISQAISSLVQILEEEKEHKNKIKNSFRYPLLLFSALSIAIGLIFYYVIPNFEYIFILQKDNLPLATTLLLSFKSYITKYYIIVILFFITLYIISKFLYKKYRFYYDKFLLTKIPIISKLIKSYILYKLFLAILLLINSQYQFQIALDNIKPLINNKYLQTIIDNIIYDLKNGYSIPEAFKKTNIFDNLIIKLLFTAQHTSNYNDILNEIISIYKQNFTQNLKTFNTFIEPFAIFIISLIILWLILALMTPIWNLSSNI